MLNGRRYKKKAASRASGRERYGLKYVTVFYGGRGAAVYVFSYSEEQHGMVMRLRENMQSIRYSAEDVVRWCEGHGIECSMRRLTMRGTDMERERHGCWR